MIRKSIQARPPESIKTPTGADAIQRRREGRRGCQTRKKGPPHGEQKLEGFDGGGISVGGCAGSRVLLVSGSTILSPNPSSAFDN